MRDGRSKKSKLSWLKKLLNLKKEETENQDEQWRTHSINREFSKPLYSHVTHLNNYRMFVATWNVAGKSPPGCLNLDDWLHTSPSADIYVLGFQEIVPLNAGNVLGAEDNLPARKWLGVIRRTLNSLPGTSDDCFTLTPSPFPDPVAELDADFERQNDSFFHRRSFQTLSRSMRFDTQPRLDRRFSVCDRTVDRWGFDDYSMGAVDSPVYTSIEEDEGVRYCLVVSKQMVGIFLTVWIKNEFKDRVKNMKVSCVGRGLMGYLGNKGSISISMSLDQTSFCFVCSHLTSGQKEGDELRRNSDVMEILRKTRFPRLHGMKDAKSPQTILDHDRIIWLGDLNYRIALSYRTAKTLVEMQNWGVLLENDQLCIEQRRGRVFEGWNEGKIYFPPTYKYSNNSDRYIGEVIRSKEKRRTPAWCDRILWYGSGLTQLSYVRGETRFSDHRPVYSIFFVEVESINHNWVKRSMSSSGSRVEIEELLPYSYDPNIY